MFSNETERVNEWLKNNEERAWKVKEITKKLNEVNDFEDRRKRFKAWKEKGCTDAEWLYAWGCDPKVDSPSKFEKPSAPVKNQFGIVSGGGTMN